MSPETYSVLQTDLKWLLAIAWLLPLAGFAIEVFAGYWSHRLSKAAAYLAVGCIATGFVCSTVAFIQWNSATDAAALHADAHHGEHPMVHGEGDEHDDHAATAHTDHAAHEIPAHTPVSGTYYYLAKFGSLSLSIDYYIDSLTLVMFMMVTFIATCIHIFAIGYMSDELTEDYVDHEVHTAGGGHFHRPGRFYRFFSYMSLFCFSMLGLVLAGNIFQVFIFWELVGICSYLLIGFYVERKSATTAANKAFIVNRVGDFGFLIGLMILWTTMGTFSFGDYDRAIDGRTEAAPGLFTMVRGGGELDISEPTEDETARVVYLQQDTEGTRLADSATGAPQTIPYMLLVVAGLGIFAGCVGKSAQFPLQTWLPDAMEGPTPVSALVHSATMVAAGVYLAGRCFPLFTPEVLLTIAYVGCITLFVAATIAVVATDIKKVLAYSTISQLGYMMLAIGVGGWGAGLFHLVTHAFFKSLLFLCSGSVIYACHHVQEMPRMGGLWKKIPITAATMLIGVIAIAGLAIPTPAMTLAFSGYHSKDAVVATALAFANQNPAHFVLFIVPLITAGITAFYMFRLWFYTFAGQPRDQHVYDHAHESPWVMTGPLIVLSVLAAFCAVGGEDGWLYKYLTFSEPTIIATQAIIALPTHDDVHHVHAAAGWYALFAAVLGAAAAFVLYAKPLISPADIQRQFSGLHTFLAEKWRFDDLYDVAFVRPTRVVAGWAAAFDRVFIDGFLHGTCRAAIDVSRWDRRFDEQVVDRLVNLVGEVTFAAGRSLRTVQTGQLRQYIMFIGLGVLTLFVLLVALFPSPL
jgi:NADH-quinone oxidoreductase subunit L